MDDDFNIRVESYLAKKLGVADARVASAIKLTSGISRTTIKVDLAQGSGFERSVIVRLDPPSSLVDSGRHVEFSIYRALGGVCDLKIPEAVANEDDPELLGAPFLMAKLLPGTTNPVHLLSASYEVAGPQIARESFEILGRVAKIDHHRLNSQPPFDVPVISDIWQGELNRWEEGLRENFSAERNQRYPGLGDGASWRPT